MAKKKTNRRGRSQTIPENGGWKERIARDGFAAILAEIRKISDSTNGVKFTVSRTELRAHLFARGVHYRAQARKIETGEVDIFPKIPKGIGPRRVVGSTIDAEFEEIDTKETREFYQKQAAEHARSRAEAFDFMGSHLIECESFVIDERTAESYELIPMAWGIGAVGARC